MAERNSARMSKITNDDLTRSGTGCSIASTHLATVDIKGLNNLYWTAAINGRRPACDKHSSSVGFYHGMNFVDIVVYNAATCIGGHPFINLTVTCLLNKINVSF